MKPFSLVITVTLLSTVRTFVPKDSVLDEVRRIGRDSPLRFDRSFKLIGETVDTCLERLATSGRSETALVNANESSILRLRVCNRSTSWGAFVDPSVESKSAREDVQHRNTTVMFAVSTYVADAENQHVFSLCLGSILHFHPGALVLVADNQSPIPGLVAEVVAARGRETPTARLSVVWSYGRAPGAPAVPAPLPGKEIGALREAIKWGESLPAPPDYVVLLQHSTGLRVPVPVLELMSLGAKDRCRSFALDIPWFRYLSDNSRLLLSRYGLTNEITVQPSHRFAFWCIY